MGALCSSAQASETQGRASPASAPVANPAASGGGVGGDGGRSSTTAAVPASAGIAQPSDGTVIIDHATAHLENNEADGGALEVYLDDDLGGGYQARAGQSADPLGTKRRPSMIIPAGHEFEPSLDPDAVTLGATIGSGSFGKVVHGHFESGDSFGVLSLMLDERRTASVKTMTYTDIFLLQREDFERIKRDYPELTEVLKKSAADRSEKMTGLVMDGVNL